MEARTPFQHPEDELRVRPGAIHHRRAAIPPARPWLWWEHRDPRPKTRRNVQHTLRRGGGTFLLPAHPRQQRVLVKPTVAKTRGGNAWYLHGVYLQREGAQQRGRGLGFDRARDDVSLSQTLARWQRAGDRHLFKVIVSPENGQELDLRQLGRDLMAVVDEDLGTQTEWAAIDHYNTGHPHLHLLIRGRDVQGQELQIDADYLWDGLRVRAREVATRTLGWRTAQEIAQGRERAVGRDAWTELDEALQRRMNGERQITLSEDGSERLTPHEVARLQALTQRGLVWQDSDRLWEMSRAWEQELKARGEAHAHQHERERGRERGREHQRDQEQEQRVEPDRGENAQQRQQRLAQIIDLEHDLGWDR